MNENYDIINKKMKIGEIPIVRLFLKRNDFAKTELLLCSVVKSYKYTKIMVKRANYFFLMKR